MFSCFSTPSPEFLRNKPVYFAILPHVSFENAEHFADINFLTPNTFRQFTFFPKPEKQKGKQKWPLPMKHVWFDKSAFSKGEKKTTRSHPRRCHGSKGVTPNTVENISSISPFHKLLL